MWLFYFTHSSHKSKTTAAHELLLTDATNTISFGLRLKWVSTFYNFRLRSFSLRSQFLQNDQVKSFMKRADPGARLTGGQTCWGPCMLPRIFKCLGKRSYVEQGVWSWIQVNLSIRHDWPDPSVWLYTLCSLFISLNDVYQSWPLDGKMILLDIHEIE